MKIKVLVENSACEGFSCEHGLSLFAEYNHRNYLVDAGAGCRFAENAEKMQVDLSSVDTAFLSHAHSDHSAGFGEFFARNSTAKVFLQKQIACKRYYMLIGPNREYAGIPEELLEQYKDRFEFVDGYRDLGNGIRILPHTTADLARRGELAHMAAVEGERITADDFSHEQTVVFEEEDGLVLVNSCSHAGVENIIEEVRAAMPGKRIKAFFGGFHMMGLGWLDTCAYTENEVKSVAEQIKENSDAVFYTGHCTGNVAFPWLKEVLGDRLIRFCAGMDITV